MEKFITWLWRCDARSRERLKSLARATDFVPLRLGGTEIGGSTT